MNCTKVVFEKKVCHVPHMLKVTFQFSLGRFLKTVKYFHAYNTNGCLRFKK